MDSVQANRFKAYKGILTLRKKFSAVIEGDLVLKAAFEDLDQKVQATAPLITEIANRSDAFTIEKNAKRDAALTLAAQLGNSLFVMAVQSKNAFLKAQCTGWRSASSLGSGSREVVEGKLRSMIGVLRENAAVLVPKYLLDADITELEVKFGAFTQSLDNKSAAINDQLLTTGELPFRLSKIGELVNNEITPTVKSLETDQPAFFKAYQIARRVRKTTTVNRKAKTTVGNTPKSATAAKKQAPNIQDALSAALAPELAKAESIKFTNGAMAH